MSKELRALILNAMNALTKPTARLVTLFVLIIVVKLELISPETLEVLGFVLAHV